MLLHAVPTWRENTISKVSTPEGLQTAWFIWQGVIYLFLSGSSLQECKIFTVKCSCKLLSDGWYFFSWIIWTWKTNSPVVFLTCFSLAISLCKRVWAIPTGKSLWLCWKTRQGSGPFSPKITMIWVWEALGPESFKPQWSLLSWSFQQ